MCPRDTGMNEIRFGEALAGVLELILYSIIFLSLPEHLTKRSVWMRCCTTSPTPPCPPGATTGITVSLVHEFLVYRFERAGVSKWISPPLKNGVLTHEQQSIRSGDYRIILQVTTSLLQHMFFLFHVMTTKGKYAYGNQAPLSQ